MTALNPRTKLLRWYRKHARVLPWRSRPEPWAVLVSELMLQQTQVKTVLPRFVPFMTQFPSPQAMVDAGEEAVIAAWAGLGYYRRARSLHAAACAIVAEHGGKVPADLDALRQLKGVGAYTAAAVGSIAYGLEAAVVDGNVERVLARFYAVEDPARQAAGKRRIEGLAQAFLNTKHPGDHNQAMMELGARVCTPRRAQCGQCPLRADCAGQTQWWAFPVLPPRPSRVPQLHEGRVLLIDARDQMAWRRRPAEGLYAHLPDLPALDTSDQNALAAYGVPQARAQVRQRLSHRELHLDGFLVRVDVLPPNCSHGPVGAFLAEGPPTPVARLVRTLLDEEQAAKTGQGAASSP